jgi:hypothetical protein
MNYLDKSRFMELNKVVFDQTIQVEDSAVESQAAMPAPARIKVVNPLTSLGPSMQAEVLGCSDANLRVRVPRLIVAGSTVQIRTRGRTAFGEVRSSISTGAEFEIEVDVRRST